VRVEENRIIAIVSRNFLGYEFTALNLQIAGDAAGIYSTLSTGNKTRRGLRS
jgi:hypothetical protein